MIDLVCQAETENVKRISVPSDHTFFLRLTCINCREEFPNAIGVSSDMVVEGLKGATVSVQMKCKGCDRVHDITIQEYDENNGWAPDKDKDGWCRLATFEVRGVDPVAAEVRDGFIVEAEDGTSFDDVDLSEEWMDVDDKGVPVSVISVCVCVRNCTRALRAFQGFYVWPQCAQRPQGFVVQCPIRMSAHSSQRRTKCLECMYACACAYVFRCAHVCKKTPLHVFYFRNASLANT